MRRRTAGTHGPALSISVVRSSIHRLVENEPTTDHSFATHDNAVGISDCRGAVRIGDRDSRISNTAERDDDRDSATHALRDCRGGAVESGELISIRIPGPPED